MILSELVRLYDRLDSLPRFGYTTQRIDGRVVLRPDGSLHAIEQLADKGVSLDVPHPGGKRTSKITPYFLWDKGDYALGRNPKDEAAGKADVIAKRFAAFRKLHLDAEREIADPDFSILCRFLNQWDPNTVERMPNWQRLVSGNFVFQILAQPRYLHEIPACRAWWEKHAEALIAGGAQQQCLATGSVGGFALTHLPIKGVADKPGAPSEKALISVNKDKTAFESYDKQQGENSPISHLAAFKYVTALNWLLRFGSCQRLTLGDTTVVFWTAKPTQTESLFAEAFGGIPPGSAAAQDQSRLSKVRQFLTTLCAGGGRAAPGEDDPGTPFYLLGLAPNAARLSVRFWQVSTLGDLAAKLAAHYEALRLVREFGDDAKRPDPEFPTIRDLLNQTATVRKDGLDRDTISPLLGGALLRAVLTGGPYPHAFASAIVRRIRADGRLTYLRCAALKAFLSRVNSTQPPPPMSLDPSNTQPAYILGRLFAALEKTQQDALGAINAGIRERYYGAASATPAAVFARLLRTYQHHLAKLEAPHRIAREKLVGEIQAALPARPYPGFLSLEEQTLFALGYYHQRQAFFTKKAEADAA